MSTTEKINETPFSKEMRDNFLEYAKYVITDRALPDARDGLKPVHRRILFAMNELGLGPQSPHKKCSRIFGETTGKFHPHAGGVYESLVRLGQHWSLRYPLVDPQGNFGSIDGFPPAAMRYTEARLTSISYDMMRNMDNQSMRERIVPFRDNFDGEEKEPVVLPTKVPNLLLNGSYGIAVGMSSNIPSYNLTELMEACIAIVDDNDITIEELCEIVKGPDFATGGTIVGTKGAYDIAKRGKGSLKIRSTYHTEFDADPPRIVITELPYLQDKGGDKGVIFQIANLIGDNKLRGVTNVEDKSGDGEIRIEIEIEEQYANDESVDTILSQLFDKTSLQTMFHVRINALAYGKPRRLNLKESLSIFLDFREETIRNIAIIDLQKVSDRLHILEGLILAADDIQNVIDLIRSSNSRSHAHDRLRAKYTLSEPQADAILNMTLGRLARTEVDDLLIEQKEKEKERDRLDELINNRSVLLAELRKELEDTLNRFGDERRTTIIHKDKLSKTTERPILHPRTLLVTATREGHIRTIEYNKFKTQGRGGRGVAGVPIEEDKLNDMLVVSNLDDLLLITSEGIIHQIPAYELPEVSRRTSKGSKIIRYLPVEDPVVKVVNVEHDRFDDDRYLVTVTKNGIVKRSALSDYSNIRRTGIICLSLKEDDEVVEAFISEGDSIFFIATKKGQAAVFEEDQVRVMGRTAQGVIGIRVQEGDEVVSAFAVKKAEYENTSIFTVTENGYGKRTHLTKYRVTNRNVKGVINLKVVDKNGPVVTSMPVPIDAGDSNMSLINSDGILIKVRISSVRNMGRSTQGVKVMRIKGDQKLVMASSVIDEGEEEEIEEDEEDLAEIAKDQTDEVLEEEEEEEVVEERKSKKEKTPEQSIDEDDEIVDAMQKYLDEEE